MEYRTAILILLLALPLMGANTAHGGGGCSCRQTAEDQIGEEGSGGGVAKSLHYSLNRSELGASFSTPASESELYHSSAWLGNNLNQIEILSDSYKIRHLFTKKILKTPLTLQTEYDELLEARVKQSAER